MNEANLKILREWKAAAKPVVVSADEFVPGCTGKVHHPTRPAAAHWIKKAADPSLGPYQCRNCQGWHTGHPEKRRRRKR